MIQKNDLVGLEREQVCSGAKSISFLFPAIREAFQGTIVSKRIFIMSNLREKFNIQRGFSINKFVCILVGKGKCKMYQFNFSS
jgi:hypothetical protein